MKPIPLLVLCFAVPLGLTACATGQGVPERSLYDLGGEPAARADAPLRVELAMPEWLDRGEIAYRLLFDEPARLRAYANSRWADEPALLIASRLKQRFAGGSPRCSVRVEVDEFAQHFARADQSQQVLAARWTIRNTSGETLADGGRRFALATPSADAKGGVAAAAALVEQLAAAIAADAARLEPCRAR